MANTPPVGKAAAFLPAPRPAFPLLPDEDAAAYARHERQWLDRLAPTGVVEHHLALAAIRAMWRAGRAQRLEAIVQDEVAAAGRIEDAAQRKAAQQAALKAVAAVARYRLSIKRDQERAMRQLEALRAQPAEPARRRERHGVASECALAGTTSGVLTQRQAFLRVVATTAAPSAPAAARVLREPDPPARLDRHGRRPLATRVRHGRQR